MASTKKIYIGNENNLARLLYEKPTFPIYGVEWEGLAETSMIRTDASADFPDPTPAVGNGTGSSPFDNIYPWAGMQKYEDDEAGTLVAIPKFFYNLKAYDNNRLKLQISMAKHEGFKTSPAHSDRGDGKGERDFIYVGRYFCDSSYKSTSGESPVVSKTRNEFRTNIHALGDSIWQYDYATHITIWFLYMVEFANWNSKEVVGKTKEKHDTGLTDSMQYHTGTTANDRATAGSVQYRNIENLWGNVYFWCDGLYGRYNQTYKSTTVACIKNPSDFSDNSGGVAISPIVSYSQVGSGYIRAFRLPSKEDFGDWCLFPYLTTGGSSTTYVTDNYTQGTYNSSTILNVAAVGSRGSGGLFLLTMSFNATTTSAYIGGRLQKLP